MVDIKKSFYDVTKSLCNEPNRNARRLMGAACEDWLKREICSILNFESGEGVQPDRGEFVYDEDEKRDISIYRDTEKGVKLLHHVELKVVYPGYSRTTQAEWVNSLQEQLERARGEGESGGARRHGWVFGVWTDYYKNVDQNRFFSETSKCLREVFSEQEYTTQHSFSMEGVLDEWLPWRGGRVEVVMKGTCFSQRTG